MNAENTEGKAPRLPLTMRQREVLDFVVSYLKTHGYAPKYEEIGVRLGIGRATVAEHVQ